MDSVFPVIGLTDRLPCRCSRIVVFKISLSECYFDKKYPTIRAQACLIRIDQGYRSLCVLMDNLVPLGTVRRVQQVCKRGPPLAGRINITRSSTW